MDLHRFGIKFFAEGGERLEILKLIPMYHRWIQQNLLSDLLIDVADYSHVPGGPGIMLIAYEGNYALDETGHERGVLYYSKHRLAGSLPERLACVASKALKAAELMSADRELDGALRLAGNRLQFFSNDRLVAPNTEAAWRELEPALKVFLQRLYAGAPYHLTRETDPKERLSVRVQAEGQVTIQSLLSHLN